MNVHDELLELRALRLRAHLEPHELDDREHARARNDILLQQLRLEAAVEDLLDDVTGLVSDSLEPLAERIAVRWRARRAAKLMRRRR